MAIPNNTSPSQNEGDAQKKRQSLEAWLEANRFLLGIFLDAYCIVDAENRVVEFNEAFTELTGESYRKILKIGDFCTVLKTQLCPGECPAKQVFNQNKSVRIDEVHGETKSYQDLQMIVGGVPIQDAAGQAIGVLLTIRNVTAESELQKKYDERKKESIVDGLTQLYNKVYTEGALLRGVKNAFRQNEGTFSVVMCDIDHFKKVNDTYGHQAGDYVLSNVAKILKEEARDTDIVGRFGGEEFMAVLPNTDMEGALVFCERFRKRVQNTKLVHNDKHIPVTISMGTATLDKVKSEGLDPALCVKDLVNRADTALYFAKANGRNRCCQSETLSGSNTAEGDKAPLKKAS
ncbi:sensor domain-containing diguanylate cyclase [bacterium]|nr:sensor domain-containing diguanylate cyclase [bacterium]